MSEQKYWLCCASVNPLHHASGCIEGKSGHSERCRFGTSDEHSAWSKPEPGQPAAVQHTDDIAVDRFAAAMKGKLAKKRAQGRGGWEECPPEDLTAMLIRHIGKGDPVDVANFAMMLHQTGNKLIASESDYLKALRLNIVVGQETIDQRDDYINYLQIIAQKIGIEDEPHQSYFDRLLERIEALVQPAAGQSEPVADARADTLFEAIKHGDAAHQEWLRDAIQQYFTSHPIPAAPAMPEWFAEIETKASELAGMLPSQQMAHAAAALHKQLINIRWRNLFGSPEQQGGAE